MCGLSRSVYNTRTEGQVKGLPYIESSKILCCECEAAVWVLREDSVQIRFCTHCKKFYPLNSFSKKGRKKSNVLLNTCSFCRDRFALTYAKTRNTETLVPLSLAQAKQLDPAYQQIMRRFMMRTW